LAGPATTSVDDLSGGHFELVTFACAGGLAGGIGIDIQNQAAPVAHQMVMVDGRIGVVASWARPHIDLADLPHGDQLAKSVVDGGTADLGQKRGCPSEYLVGGEVHVATL
jgi:hypothetical protein